MALANHVKVLTSPEYLEDPVAAAETILKALVAKFAAKPAAQHPASIVRGIAAQVGPGVQPVSGAGGLGETSAGAVLNTPQPGSASWLLPEALLLPAPEIKTLNFTY